MSKVDRMHRRQLLVAGGLMLAGCGADAPTAKPLEFWTMQLQPEFTALIQGMLTAFSQAHPTAGAIKWVDVPWADMERKILAAVAAGTAPDVVNLNPQFAVKLAQRQALLPLDQAVPASDQALYFPSFWQANRLDGITFGVPWYVSTQVTIYNQTLFKKAGLTAAPKTYADLAALAQALRKIGKYAFLPTFDTGQILEALVKMGVTLLDRRGKAAFDSPIGLSAAQFWVDLYRNKLIPRESLTEGHRKAIELYQSEETALLLSGPQFLSSITKNAPQLTQVTAVAPQLTGKLAKTNAATMNLVVPKSTSQPELALQLALFITNNVNQLALAKAGNLLPSTQQAAQDSYFTAPGRDPITQGRRVSAQQLATAAVLIPPCNNLDQLQQFIYEELQQAMLDKKTAAAALRAAALRWDALV